MTTTSSDYPTYRNPVYPHACPDPFVLKAVGEYWAYGTGLQPDGRAFPILRSPDLVHWTEVGTALAALPGGHPCYWAPEVSDWNGRYYLYYSVGNEELMQIRVAVADHPAGPFVDSGRRLTREDFAIDAHVFEDDDGSRYLFYATDYLSHTHIGTGTAVDRLLDPFTLAGQPRPVTRARYDWQVYDPQRQSKGGVRWHTVEGPFVLKHKGRYYQMFSGGNWQNVSYGVSYATTDRLDTPDEWEQVCDGRRVLPILRTVPGQVIGPGHNSVVVGPDNRQLFCVYHRWAADGSARVLCLDRLDFVGDRILIVGPTTTPQPAPLQPTVNGFGADNAVGLGPGWQPSGGQWGVSQGAALQASSAGSSGAHLALPAADFVLEVSLRAVEDPSGRGGYGLSLYNDAAPALVVTLQPGQGHALVGWHTGTELSETSLALPPDFNPAAYHRLRVELNAHHAHVSLDHSAVRWQGRLGLAPTGLALRTVNTAAAFTGLALTVGWQDVFDGEGDPTEAGWQGAMDGWTVGGGELRFEAVGDAGSALRKGPRLPDYELVVNARLDPTRPGAGYGVYPALTDDGSGPLLMVEHHGDGWALVQRHAAAAAQVFPLPGFDPAIYQQFRFWKRAGRLAVQWETQPLGEIAVPAAPTSVGLAARGRAAFDMVRLTHIP